MAEAPPPAWRNRHQFDRLIEAYYSTVFAVTMARLQDREAAEDLAQEVFLRAFLQFDPALGADRFGAWTVCVARHLAVDWTRRQVRQSALVAALPVESHSEALAMNDPQPGAAERLLRDEQSRLLDAALAELSADEREVVLLHFYEDLPKATIASRLGVHPSTVGRQIDRALVALQAELRPLLRPGRRPVERTLCSVSAAAALGTAAKSQILGGAAVQQGTAAAVALADEALGNSLISKGAATAVHGALAMGKGKIMAGVVAALALVAVGGGVYQHRVNAPANGPGSAEWSAVQPYAGPDLPSGWTLKVADSAPNTLFSATTDMGVEVKGMDLNNALGNWSGIALPPQIAPGIDPRLQKDIELVPPLGTPRSELQKVSSNS